MTVVRNADETIYTSIGLTGSSESVNSVTISTLLVDGDGNILMCTGTTVPTDGSSGYAKGCQFIKTNGSTATTTYINEGSTTSSDFNAIESSASTITAVTAGTGLTGGGTEGSVTLNVGSGTGITANANDVQIAAGYLPSHIVKYAGKITWSGSGASLATTVTGVASTDIVVATIQTAPTEAAYLVSAAPTTNTVTLVLSAANTSNDAVIAYTVFRAVS